MSWIDISVPIRPGMIVYEGDPPVELRRAASLADGDPSNVSRMDLGVHTGTHVDAPVHFIDGAGGVEALPLDAMLGPAVVIDATGADSDLDDHALAGLGIPAGAERILFKTPNSRLWDEDAFSPNFIGITEAGARWLVERGARLVGIDYLSVAPQRDPAPTHRALLQAGVVILEGLDLRAVEPGHYELACLPLLIPGSDGAPARALLRRP